MRLLKGLAAGTVVFALAAAVAPQSLPVSRRMEWIESGRPGPGSAFQFTPAELTLWLQREARLSLPGSVRNLRLALSADRATAGADIDFVRLRQAATGEPPGWVARNLFSGERPVTVAARLTSLHGRARVDIERVEVSGVPLEGRLLQFVIDDYVRPTFPSVRISEWFPLGYRLDRISIRPTGVTAVIRR